MTYTKPSNMSYTDMAIWIDANAHIPDADENLIYKYLYLLCYMLSKQYRYFSEEDEYDLFSIFCASRLLMRLRGHNLSVIRNTEDISSESKIKSILNYIKRVIYPYKVDYDKEFGNMSDENVEVISLGRINVAESLSDSNDVFDMFETVNTLQNSSTLIRDYLKKIPRKRNSAEWSNIYISCILTLVDQMTLDKKQMETLSKAKRNQEETLGTILKENLQRDPILYHIDESMLDHIRVLVRELRHLLSTELHWKSGEHYSAEAAVKAVLLESALEEGETIEY